MNKLKIVVVILFAIGIVSGAYYFYHRVTQKTIVVVLYDQFTLLDAVGAYQAASGLMLENYDIKFVAKANGRVQSSHLQSLVADNDFRTLSKADILILPGLTDYKSVITDGETMSWIRQVNENADRTLAIGSGVAVLASTGVLSGKKATGPWYDQVILEQYGVLYQPGNYVRDGKYYTGAGASSAIDMMLALIDEVANAELSRTTQLFIAYDPQPPVQSGFYPSADSTVQRLANQLRMHTPVRTGKPKTIALYLYNGFTMLDASGPYQVFRELEPLGYRMKFVGKTKGIAQSDFIQSLETPYTKDEIDSADVLFVPGGSTTYQILADRELIKWIQSIDKTTLFTTSVCTGSVILGEARLLHGRKATSHWYVGPKLDEFGITYSGERYTKDGKYITGAGVSSGIDLALYVVKELEGEQVAKAIQLSIGYFPGPPYDAGTPEKSDPKTVKILSDMLIHATDRTAPKSGSSSNHKQASLIDPVCHMDVSSYPGDSISFDGNTYYFCSKLCKEKFQQEPSTYGHP